MQEAKRRFQFCTSVFLLIAISSLVFAQPASYSGGTEDRSSDLDSQDIWQDANADLSSATSTDVDNAISKGWVSDSNLKKISADQLSKESFESIKPKSKLSKTTLDEYTSKHSSKSVKTQTSSSTQGGTLPDGGFWFDVIDFLSVDDVSLTNGKNIRYEGNKITVDSADTITVQDGVLTVVEKFDGSDVSFRVDSASQVQIRCLVLDDVINTDFIVMQDSTRAEPDKDTTMFITDCSQTQSSFTSNTDDGKISITEHEPITYTVEDGKVIYESATHRDILETEGLSTILFDYYDGFLCTDMSPKATYSYADKLDAKRNFAVNNPSFGNIYTLCLKRMQTQEFNSATGIADFIDNKITLMNLHGI